LAVLNIAESRDNSLMTEELQLVANDYLDNQPYVAVLYDLIEYQVADYVFA